MYTYICVWYVCISSIALAHSYDWTTPLRAPLVCDTLHMYIYVYIYMYLCVTWKYTWPGFVGQKIHSTTRMHMYTWICICIYKFAWDLLVLICVTNICHTLQHTATYCNTLQHTATHHNMYIPISRISSCVLHTLQHAATHCSPLQHTTPFPHLSYHSTHVFDTLPHTATHWTHCNTLQHNATQCNSLQLAATHYRMHATSAHNGDRQSHICIATHCNTLQHAAIHYNTLQHTAPHCNPLQLTTGCMQRVRTTENDSRQL